MAIAVDTSNADDTYRWLHSINKCTHVEHGTNLATMVRELEYISLDISSAEKRDPALLVGIGGKYNRAISHREKQDDTRVVRALSGLRRE
jgi:hypothetical protein